MQLVGYENVENQVRGTLRVLRLVTVKPLRWAAKCLRCGTETNYTHERLQNYPICANSVCGMQTAPSSGSSSCAETVAIGPARRSRDSDAYKEYLREDARQQQQRVSRSESYYQNEDPQKLLAEAAYLYHLADSAAKS